MPDSIEERMAVVEKLTRLFKVERMVYLSVTIISLIMLLGTGASFSIKGGAGAAELSQFFGFFPLIT